MNRIKDLNDGVFETNVREPREALTREAETEPESAENASAEDAPDAKMYEALRESERRYRDFFENAKDAIYVHDLNGRYTLVNTAGEHLIGYSRAEILRMSVFDVVPPDYVEKTSKSMTQKLADPTPTIYEVEIIRKDRSRVPVEVSSRLIFENGRPVGVQGTARDISERRRAQAALRDSEERFRGLFENAKDVVFTCDLSGNFTSMNKAGELLTEYSREEALHSSFARVVAPEYLEIVRQMISGKAEGDVATVYELEIITKSGRHVLVEVSSRTVHSGGRPIGIQGSARDITERKRAEEALQASQIQLQQSQKLEAIGQLAGGVAHDFNNLLTVITGYSDLALRRIGLGNPLQHNLEEIKKASDRAASLTRQLLAFSRKQILEPRVLDLNFVVSDMHKMLRRLIGEDIHLFTRLANDLGRIRADPGQIEQIIMNMVVNARDAMPAGGDVIIETAGLSLDDRYVWAHQPTLPGPYVMLAISDTGIGMDAETRERIFEPFFTTKQLGKGTGLGLSTVYGIVKQSGGYVWVYSEPNRGTTFKVYLPQVEEDVRETKNRVTAGPVKGWETLLLVEDDPSVRAVAREILESSGYRTLETTTIEEAIRTCNEYEGRIHLLLTDVVMPNMSGRELAGQLTAQRPEMKVLFMSGYTNEAIVHHGVLDPGINFLQKPFTPELLGAKVRDALDSDPAHSRQI